MANLHAEYLTSKEVLDAIRPILQKGFGRYQFEDASVSEERDFDDQHVLRVVAKVGEKVPAREVIDTLELIHRTLRSMGEDRFVYLSTERPSEEDSDEDVE